MNVYARAPHDAFTMQDITPGEMYLIEGDSHSDTFEIFNDRGEPRHCFWRGSAFLHGRDWERVEGDESCTPSAPAPESIPNLSDILHDLLRLHIAHHNHPAHARARAALAEIADPVE